MLALYKHSSILGSFIKYKENEVLWIRALNLKHFYSRNYYFFIVTLCIWRWQELFSMCYIFRQGKEPNQKSAVFYSTTLLANVTLRHMLLSVKAQQLT
jgi:hypothetical protein